MALSRTYLNFSFLDKTCFQKFKKLESFYIGMEPSINQRLVSSLVEKMLLQSGYMIYKIEYENVLQSLVREKKIKNYNSYLKDIKKHEYDFMLIANKRPYFVQIKFCKKPELKIKEMFNQGEVIFVTIKEPVFQIANSKRFIEEKKIMPLAEFLDIDNTLLKKYKMIIKRRFHQAFSYKPF